MPSEIAVRDNKWEEAKTILLRVLYQLIQRCMYSVTGKEDGKPSWNMVLVDWDKIDEFLEKSKSNTIKVPDYGKVLDCEWGDKVPQDIIDKHLGTFFYAHRLYDGDGVCTYYVAADADKKLEMKAATSAEEMRRCGKILYSSNNEEEPAEVIAYMMKQQYFFPGSGISLTPVETACTCITRAFVDAVMSEGGEEVAMDFVTAEIDDLINTTDTRGWTLLHYFAQYNKVDILSLLINKGADIHVQDKICGRKPVVIAAKEGHQDAIEFFLRNGAIVNEIDKIQWNLAHYTAWNGNKHTMRFLIQKGANITAKELTAGRMPIHIASQFGHTEVVKILLENDAHTIEAEDKNGCTPLFFAAREARLDTAKFLISMGANFSQQSKLGMKPIHYASDTNSTEMLELFLVNEDSINEPDSKGYTPLLRAASEGHLKVIQFLVDNKADFNAVNQYGQTAFEISKDHLDVALYLAEKMVTKLQEEEKYSEAFNIYSELFEIQKEKLGPDTFKTLATWNTLANLLYKQGRFDEAVTTFADVLKARERCFGPNHTDTLCTKHGLGLVYLDQTKYKEAAKIFEEVFDKRKAGLGADHNDTLAVARDMGRVHLSEGKYEIAFNILKDVHERRRSCFGADHEETLQVSQDMAIALVNIGEYKKAVEILDGVYQKRKYTLGINHPETLSTKHQISVISQTFESELKKEKSRFRWFW